MKLAMSYSAACRHPDLFSDWFTGESWDRWRVFDKALFGEPLDAVESEIFKHLTGRQEAPTEPVKEAWLAFGRRTAKDLKSASIAAYKSTIGAKQLTQGAARGERTYVCIVAVDRTQSQIALNYIREFFALPVLAPFVKRETRDGLELNNGISLEIFTNDQRRSRGRRIGVAILDEVAHWQSDLSSNPAEEVFESLLPSMANVPGALVLGISSPHMRRGLFYKKVSGAWGKPGPILAARAATWVMNPTLPADGEFIRARYAENESWARAEFGAQERDDLEAYIGIEALRACVKPGVVEREPERRHKYVAHTDPSGGVNDSMTLCVCHKEAGGQVVVDCVREIPAPFSPEYAVEEFAAVLKRYHVRRITSDRFGGEWVREAFKRHGIMCVPAARSASQYYIDFLPQLTEGAVDLVDDERMVAQFAQLERSPRRGMHDQVDHPKGAHDDIACAVAAACVQAMAGTAYGYERRPLRVELMSAGTYYV